MCKTQCVLALVALYLGLAHSWDIVVSVGDQLIFFTDGIKTNTVYLYSHNATALAYDEVHNMMLYVDKQSQYDAVCGYNLNSKENKCFIKRVGSNIHSIAFDPATDTLFFTDTNESSINWISFKPGSNDNVNRLIKTNYVTPRDIAVDSCRGHIYWTNTNDLDSGFIERARFNGLEREMIHQHFQVYSMAMDPQTQKIYYFDGSPYRFLDSCDLDGQHEYTMLSSIYLSKIKELTVSNDYLYWMNSSVSYTTIWQLPKNAIRGVEPKEIIKFYSESPLSIAANYKIQGLQNCEVRRSLLGKIGERCDVSVCENYCLQGDRSFNDEGLPKCRCNAGYSGERCEVYACHGYCLNNGDCSLNEKNEPVCQCKAEYVGDRCEVSYCLNYCMQGECSFNEEGLPTCSCNAGYSGARCEVYACHGYCLNNGDCSLNEEDEPVCQCVDNHEGIRCEAVINTTFINSPFDFVKKNLTLADLLSSWRKPTSKMFVTVEL